MKLILKTLILFALSPINYAMGTMPLVDAAKQRLTANVVYDGSYQSIAYPNGDVDPNKGVCTDVVIRSYRALGIDLQVLVHQDMKSNFEFYPKIWGLRSPDRNIDHRRVPNLETFFKRNAKQLPLSNDPLDYLPGDIVTWRLPNNLPHIGIVSDVKSMANSNRYQIIHNIGLGPKLEDVLFSYQIKGHYRYTP